MLAAAIIRTVPTATNPIPGKYALALNMPLRPLGSSVASAIGPCCCARLNGPAPIMRIAISTNPPRSRSAPNPTSTIRNDMRSPVCPRYRISRIRRSQRSVKRCRHASKSPRASRSKHHRKICIGFLIRPEPDCSDLVRGGDRLSGQPIDDECARRGIEGLPQAGERWPLTKSSPLPVGNGSALRFVAIGNTAIAARLAERFPALVETNPSWHAPDEALWLIRPDSPQ